MGSVQVLYSNRWGDILERSGDNCVEIRWHDASSEMTEPDFQHFLEEYAECVEECGLPGGLIDTLQFKMDTSKLSPGWRDENIIPRYNEAGMKKFAFIMPEGMPAVGAEPMPEGPATFPTGYFDKRADALAWLKA